MILSFDKFERYEVPQVTLCNPNSRATEVDGKITITDTVGVLSNPKGMNLKLNFNAPHELSFDYYRHKSTDPIKQSFYDSLYEAIQTDRYIYLTDIGYFIISSVTDSDEDNIDKKSISLKSCEENELATAEGLYLKEGTYYLHTDSNDGLLDLFLPKTAGWTMGYIDPSLLTKPYYVEETEVDNGYNFLYTTIQDMFECIVEPDIIKRTISVYSRVYYAEQHLTDIHIAKYNLLKHKTVEENDEDKYTALNVQGKDENLEIRTVNPTGKNVIYNFDPRHSMMSPALQVAIEKWQEKCEAVEEEYLTLQKSYYAELEELFNQEQNIEVLKGELKTLEETKDAVIITVGDQQSTALKNVNAQITAKQKEINTATSAYNAHKITVQTTYEVPISQINADCALDITAVDIDGNTIFTVELLNELMTHIKPTEYVDEYMLVTESMTYPQRFEKAKELMDRAQSQLVKISSGQKTYSIDTRSFLFNKQFKHFSEQLCAGAIIYVETKNDIMEQLHLTGIDIKFDEKNADFTLGNKYDRSDLKALYDDALGKNSKSFSELKYIASIIEDQQKQLDYQRNWVADLRTLTLDNVLASEDQAIEINNRGLIGRKRRLDENGEWDFDENGNPYFEDEQVKLINNTLVFTNDNWNTAVTAVGKIAVGYNADGSVKYAYGMNGQVVIGELFLGNNLVLTGTGAGIKIQDSSGKNVFYADDDGDLNLTGKITATGGTIAGWNITNNKIFTGGIIDNVDSGFLPICIQKPSSATSTVFAVGGKSDHSAYQEANTRVFFVRADGFLYAENAYIKGKITATEGAVGGWNIETNRLWAKISTNNGIGMGVSSVADNGLAFYAGFSSKEDTPWDDSSWKSNTNFYVTNTGHVVCKDIDAQGGIIGNWSITGSRLENKICDSNNVFLYRVGMAAGTSSSNAAFYAGTTTESGTIVGNSAFYVTNAGHLRATDANITGTINAKTITATESGTVAGWSINSTTGFKSGNSAINANGTMALYPQIGSGGTILFNNGARISVTAGVAISSNANGAVTATNSNLDLKACSGSTAYLACMLNSNGTTERASVTCSNGVLRLYSYDRIDVIGTNGSGSTDISDKNRKNSISTLEDNYNVLFDNLLPIKYKYNEGTSNRYHTGFIAQSVGEALKKAELSTQDFAGLTIQNPNTEDELWGLRYAEFIALNTWQIQKLKRKVAELEAQIQTLTAG